MDIDECQDKIIKIVDAAFPTYTSEGIHEFIRKEIEKLLLIYKNEVIDEFCQLHDICSTCITGGYNCDSDHK